MTEIERYLEWLAEHRGLTFDGYQDLHRWSVTELAGFWSSIWEFFDVQASVPYRAVLGEPTMPGAEWFAGARLNYAQHALRRSLDAPGEPAVIGVSQTRDTTVTSWGELAEAVARACAAPSELGVRAPGGPRRRTRSGRSRGPGHGDRRRHAAARRPR